MSLALLQLVVSISACAGNTTTVRVPPATLFSTGASIAVVVAAAGDATPDECAQLQSALVEELAQAQLLSRVDIGDRDRRAPVVATCTITSIARVSRAQRGRRAQWAGKASVVVRVTMVDRKRRVVVGDADIEGVSSSHSTLAGTTEQAIRQAANGILKFIGGASGGGDT